MTDEAGQLFSFTWSPTTEVAAWARHSLGGLSSDGHTKVVAMTIHKSRPYFVIETDNGLALEKLSDFFMPEGPYDRSKSNFLDSSASFLKTKTDLWSDDIEMPWMKNEVPGVVLNGEAVNSGWEDTPVVSNEGVLSPESYREKGLYSHMNRLLVGRPYFSVVETLPLWVDSDRGNVQGRTKRAERVVMELSNSVGLGFGKERTKLTYITGAVKTHWNLPEALFTGELSTEIEFDYQANTSLIFQEHGPVPLELLNFSMELNQY